MPDPTPVLDLGRPRHLHVTNVGGAGMSAVAALLAEMGHVVTGHDPLATSPFLALLGRVGVQVATGLPVPELGSEVEAVVVSTATPSDHPQLSAARARSIPVLHRADGLAALPGDEHLQMAALVRGTG